MSHDDFLKLRNQAIERGEYVPVLHEYWVTWIEKHINGFREVLENITVDELLKDMALPIKKFDEYFS